MKSKTRGRDLTGLVFGRLTAIKLNHRDNNSNSFWLCKCICGNKSVVRIGDLTSGNTTSCGCYRTERSNEALIKRSITHGETGTRLYNIWRSMKQRCNYKKHIGYERYGGRGIGICDEWNNSYESFKDWAMFSGYEDNLTIDRINNDGNYEPNNCRWVDHRSQANNRRYNKKLSYKGEVLTISEWAEKLGVNKSTLSMRLRSGWSVEDTLEKTVRKYGNAT